MREAEKMKQKIIRAASVRLGVYMDKIIRSFQSLDLHNPRWLSELDSGCGLLSWVDTLRAQLSDLQGRTLGGHSQTALARIRTEFQQLLHMVDSLAFD